MSIMEKNMVMGIRMIIAMTMIMAKTGTSTAPAADTSTERVISRRP
jgi:hypothetical protein